MVKYTPARVIRFWKPTDKLAEKIKISSPKIRIPKKYLEYLFPREENLKLFSDNAVKNTSGTIKYVITCW